MGLSISDLDMIDEATWMDMMIITMTKAGIQNGKIKLPPPKATKAQIDELFSKKRK